MAKLRIISGEIKGRCVTVDGGAGFRPTQERVRESAAEIVKRKIPGAAAADLCAGSGAFGFEMLSRGAASVDFVELDGALAAGIAANAKTLGVDGRARVVREDVRRFAEAGGKYDLIFYDPPYDAEELRELAPKVANMLAEDGVLIYERRRRRNEKKAAASDWGGAAQARAYADTVLEIHKRGGNADSALPGDL